MNARRVENDTIFNFTNKVPLITTTAVYNKTPTTVVTAAAVVTVRCCLSC